MNLLKGKFISIALPVFSVIAIFMGVRGLGLFWNLHQGEKDIAADHGALASERLEPYRERVTTFERGCSAYLKSNFQAHRLDRIQWGAESCSSNGVDLPEVTIALAAGKESGGESQEALNLLVEAAPKYKGSAMIYLKIFAMMKSAKNDQGMRFAMLKAVDQAPDDLKVLWAALQFFSSQSKWEDAKQMAARIKDLPGANIADIKFLAARAFHRSGDAATAGAIAEQGKTLIATKPEMQERFKKEYPEFFAGGDVAAPAVAGVPEQSVPPMSGHVSNGAMPGAVRPGGGSVRRPEMKNVLPGTARTQ